jgi:surface polysaccharide O-acyltransferase-like enzyme
MIPWLNKMLQSCSKQEATKLVFMIAIVFVIYVTFVSQSGVIFSIGNVFSLENGFSFVWLLILYIIGAWIKKCDVSFCLKNCTLLIGIVACVLLAWVTKIYFSTEIFISYISFNIVFIAFALVCIFSKLQLKQITQKIVICFAPASFGVYLIHQQKLIRAHFMYCAFTWIADLPCWLLVIAVLASAFCIYICCLIVEKIRLKLFCLLRIDKLIDNIATVIENLVLKIYSKGIKFYENSSNRS